MLSLYDCLIPKLREHRKLRIRPELAELNQNTMADLKTAQRVFQLEYDLQQKKVPTLEAANNLLRE